MLTPEFQVHTARGTKNNPQRVKALAEGEDLSWQWDTHSDDPFSHSENIRMADQKYCTTEMTVEKDGAHTTVHFKGLTLGQFSG